MCALTNVEAHWTFFNLQMNAAVIQEVWRQYSPFCRKQHFCKTLTQAKTILLGPANKALSMASDTGANFSQINQLCFPPGTFADTKRKIHFRSHRSLQFTRVRCWHWQTWVTAKKLLKTSFLQQSTKPYLSPSTLPNWGSYAVTEARNSVLATQTKLQPKIKIWNTGIWKSEIRISEFFINPYSFPSCNL